MNKPIKMLELWIAYERNQFRVMDNDCESKIERTKWRKNNWLNIDFRQRYGNETNRVNQQFFSCEVITQHETHAHQDERIENNLKNAGGQEGGGGSNSN